ncbi:uncharacterized protein [Antennarius striatus]|uniref:uncharacterized protein n=1 Tax=Antennarius striatus TaxID=241820 RepID=UPI0035B14402
MSVKSQSSPAVGGVRMSSVTTRPSQTTNPRKPLVQVRIHLPDKLHSLSALVDSGAEANIMDSQLARQWNLKCQSLPTPARALDGHPLGIVTHVTAPVQMSIPGNHQEAIQFHLLRSPSQAIILGYPWLRRHNPRIDWVTGSILEWSKNSSGSQGCWSLSQWTLRKRQGTPLVRCQCTAEPHERHTSTHTVTPRDNLRPAIVLGGERKPENPRRHRENIQTLHRAGIERGSVAHHCSSWPAQFYRSKSSSGTEVAAPICDMEFWLWYNTFKYFSSCEKLGAAHITHQLHYVRSLNGNVGAIHAASDSGKS